MKNSQTTVEFVDRFGGLVQPIDFGIPDFDFAAIEFVPYSDLFSFRDPFEPFQGDDRLVFFPVVPSMRYETDRSVFQEMTSVDVIACRCNGEADDKWVNIGFLSNSGIDNFFSLKPAEKCLHP